MRLKGSNSDVQGRLDAARKRIDDLEVDLKDEKTLVTKQTAQLRQDCDKLRHRLDAAENDKSAIQARFLDLNKQRNKDKGEFAVAKMELEQRASRAKNDMHELQV